MRDGQETVGEDAFVGCALTVASLAWLLAACLIVREVFGL